MKKAKHKGHIFYDSVMNVQNWQIHSDRKSSLVVARGWGERGEWGGTVDGSMVCFGGDENILDLNIGDGCTTW